MGKSGTTYAHLHFAVFKVNPSEIGGIDVIAKTQDQLNKWWEDPFLTLNTKTESTDMMPDYLKTLIQEAGIKNEGEFRAFWEKAIKYDDKVKELNNEIKTVNEALADRSHQVAVLTDDKEKLEEKRDEAQKNYLEERDKLSKTAWELTQANIRIELLDRQVENLEKEIETFKEKNDIYAYNWWDRLFSLFKRG